MRDCIAASCTGLLVLPLPTQQQQCPPHPSSRCRRCAAVDVAEPNFVRRLGRLDAATADAQSVHATAAAAAAAAAGVSQLPNDALYSGRSTLWHLNQVSAPVAWQAVGGGSQEVGVCVVDSGARPDHEDLKERIVGGWNRCVWVCMRGVECG